MTPEQDDLDQLAYSEARLRPMRDRLGEPLPDEAHDELQLAALPFWQVVQVLLHRPSVAVCEADAKGIS